MTNGAMKSNPMKIEKLPVKTRGDAMYLVQLTVNYLIILILIQRGHRGNTKTNAIFVVDVVAKQKRKLVDFHLK